MTEQFHIGKPSGGEPIPVVTLTLTNKAPRVVTAYPLAAEE